MKIKVVLAVALLIVVVIFTLQNTDVVPVTLLLWKVYLSTALLMFIVLCMGILIGFFLGSHARKKSQGKDKDFTAPGSY